MHAAAKSASTGGWVKKHVTPSWAKEFLPQRLRCWLILQHRVWSVFLRVSTYIHMCVVLRLAGLSGEGLERAFGDIGQPMAKKLGKCTIPAFLVCTLQPRINLYTISVCHKTTQMHVNLLNVCNKGYRRRFLSKGCRVPQEVPRRMEEHRLLNLRHACEWVLCGQLNIWEGMSLKVSISCGLVGFCWCLFVCICVCTAVHGS